MATPIFRITLHNETYDFTPLYLGNITEHPGPGHPMRWGAFEANYWFHVGSARTERASARKAANYLRRR